MSAPDERRSEERTEVEEQASLVVARIAAPDTPPVRMSARLVDRSRSGCRLALDRLQVDSLHLLECLEDAEDFRIEVTLPARKTDDPPRLAKVAWINRVFEGAGPVFRVGLVLGKPVR